MLDERRHVLEQRGLAPETVERVLLALGRPLPERCPDPSAVSLTSEPFVPDWITCALDARDRGAVPALQHRLAELNFPIAPGMRESPAYRRACLDPDAGEADWPRGPVDGGPCWTAPERIRIFLHDTGGGVLPVIEAPARDDFVILVCALGHRNEPVMLPPSMGANFLNGYANRRRFFAVRDAHHAGLLQQDPLDKGLWKDRILLLSRGPYSSVPAASLGLDETVWIEQSTAIRLHHESCHYLVRRLFPTLVFGIQDELVADFAGLMAVADGFRARDFLAFMGLEGFPEYRTGGRLENYHRQLSGHPEAILAVQHLLVDAATTLETFFVRWDQPRYHRNSLRVLAVLTHLPLEVLASPRATAALEAHFDHLTNTAATASRDRPRAPAG